MGAGVERRLLAAIAGRGGAPSAGFVRRERGVCASLVRRRRFQQQFRRRPRFVAPQFVGRALQLPGAAARLRGARGAPSIAVGRSRQRLCPAARDPPAVRLWLAVRSVPVRDERLGRCRRLGVAQRTHRSQPHRLLPGPSQRPRLPAMAAGSRARRPARSDRRRQPAESRRAACQAAATCVARWLGTGLGGRACRRSAAGRALADAPTVRARRSCPAGCRRRPVPGRHGDPGRPDAVPARRRHHQSPCARRRQHVQCRGGRHAAGRTRLPATAVSGRRWVLPTPSRGRRCAGRVPVFQPDR